jgi:hypothetical protein
MQGVRASKSIGLVLLVAFLSAGGCRTTQPLPAANLQEPAWTVRNGQAVWHLTQGNREIAGDVLVATRSDGESFLQFSKTPFPLVIGRATSDRWQVSFPPQNKHYSGHGKPPVRVLWLYVPRALSGQPLPSTLSWHEDADGWKLENRSNGEAIEGYFVDGK